MKKTLIIGAKGTLGQALVKVFQKDKNFKVIAWDKEDIDITREKEVHKKISFLHPEIILNAAGYNAVDECEKDKHEYILAKKVNGQAPGYLALVAKKNKAVLVHYSSDYVFDGKPSIPEPSGCSHSCATCSLHQDFQPKIGFQEDDHVSPINKYGETKLLGEKNVQKNMKNFYLIRLSRLFGEKAVSPNSKKNFFDMILELSKTKKTLQVIDDEIGCFTYALDLARKTKEIIDSQKPFGIYHIVNDGFASWYDGAQELFSLNKQKIEIVPVESKAFSRPAKRPFLSILINSKTNPLRDWREALKEHLKNG